MKKLLFGLMSLSILTSELASAGRLTGRRPSAAVAAKSALVRGSQVDVYRSNSQDALLNEEETEVQAGVKSASQGTTSSVIGQVYSNISLAGRRFSFQIEEIALNANNKPVVRGWMCRIGNNNNTSSTISITGGWQSSESMAQVQVPQEYCGGISSTNGRFEIEFDYFQSEQEIQNLKFTLTHQNDNYNDPNNRTKSFRLELGSLADYIGQEAFYAYTHRHLSESPTIEFMTNRVRQDETAMLFISSHETFQNNTSSPNATMCGEKNVEGQASLCMTNTDSWSAPRWSLYSAIYYFLIEFRFSISTPENDLTYYEKGGYLRKSSVAKKFRPVDFGMTPGSYTIYYKSSYGHIVSTVITVVP